MALKAESLLPDSRLSAVCMVESGQRRWGWIVKSPRCLVVSSSSEGGTPASPEQDGPRGQGTSVTGDGGLELALVDPGGNCGGKGRREEAPQHGWGRCVWRVKHREHWKGESLNPRLELVPGAIRADCVDRSWPRQVGLRDAMCQTQCGCRTSKTDMARGLHGMFRAGAETDMNQATTGTHG